MAAAMITAPLEMPTPTAWPQSHQLAIFAFVASSLSSLPDMERSAVPHYVIQNIQNRFRQFYYEFMGLFIMFQARFAHNGCWVEVSKWQRRIFSKHTVHLGFMYSNNRLAGAKLALDSLSVVGRMMDDKSSSATRNQRRGYAAEKKLAPAQSANVHRLQLQREASSRFGLSKLA